jgi:hypothetical protein
MQRPAANPCIIASMKWSQRDPRRNLVQYRPHRGRWESEAARHTPAPAHARLGNARPFDLISSSAHPRCPTSGVRPPHPPAAPGSHANTRADASSDEEPKRAAPVKKPVAVPSRFAGEDEEERGPAVRPSLPSFTTALIRGQSDWEESTSEEDAPKPAPSAAAPPKKKGTLKAKLAAKAAAAAAGEGSGSGDELYDEDAVLDPRAKARADRERELRSDLDNAAALLGTAGPPRAYQSPHEVSWGAADEGTGGEAPEALLAMNPKTKDEFEAFSRAIIDLVIKKHEGTRALPSPPLALI